MVVLLSRIPYPLEKGDKLRAFYQIKELSKKHEIYLVALNDTRIHPEAMTQLNPFCKEILILNLSLWSRLLGMFYALFKGIPIQCGYFYSPKAKRIFIDFINRIHPDHIYCQIVRVVEYVKELPFPKTLDYQDVFSKGMQRRFEKGSWLTKPLFWVEYRRLMKYEKEVFSLFDHHTIITGVDRDLIPHPEHFKIEVVANGVDFEKFRVYEQPKEFDLIFSGNMSYPPNIDAAEYIAKQIFPTLKRAYPELKLVICGASPAPKVLALAGLGITVTGWVDSMVEYYSRSRIFIAPMRLGTGLQNKLIEAMAMKLPCITSSLAGKPLEGVENGKDVIICETASGYVDAVKMVLENRDLYAQIAENGHQFVKQNYNWENTTAQLEQLIAGNNMP
ncbi:MAG: glycosyltransferase [Bacteroidales bacterium]|nr:glycosyltransferase [Bacteroidales bacterium]